MLYGTVFVQITITTYHIKKGYIEIDCKIIKMLTDIFVKKASADIIERIKDLQILRQCRHDGTDGRANIFLKYHSG